MIFNWNLAVNYALRNWDGEYEFEKDCTRNQMLIEKIQALKSETHG